MKTLRVTGVVDGASLIKELAVVLGAPGTPLTWWVNSSAGDAVVNFPDAVSDPTVQAVLDAHVSQSGIDARTTAAAALAARLATDESERLGLKASSVLMNFLNMTPAQIDAWCAANITDLASARNAIALLAKIVAVAIRRQVRNGT